MKVQGLYNLSSNTIAGTVLVCALVTTACADTIVLQDGEVVSGKISGETPRTVTISAPNGRFTFSREKVIRVTRDSPIVNQTHEMKSLIRRGNLDAAATFYRNSDLADSLSESEFAQLFLSELSETAGGVTATSTTTQLLSNKFAGIQTPPMELLLLAAALNLDAEDANHSHTLLKRIESNLPDQLVWPEKTVSILLNRIADIAIKREHGRILALTARLSTQLPLPHATSNSTEHLALYAQIEQLIRDNALLKATVLFRPDLFLHRADIFTTLADRLLTVILAAPSDDSSIAALESARVTILPYVDPVQRERCMKILVSRLMSRGEIAQAQQIADETATNLPDLGATLQHLIDFKKKSDRIPPDDPIEKYKLAAWGRSMGLLDESRSLFTALRSDPRFHETANLQLQLINQAQAKQALEHLNSLYRKQDIERLKQESVAFLQTSPPQEFAQQARDLLQLANFQEWSSKQSSYGKAEAEFQQAERLVNRREFENALIHLNRIQLDREESDAAQKAQKLRDRIMRELYKEKLKKSQDAAVTAP